MQYKQLLLAKHCMYTRQLPGARLSESLLPMQYSVVPGAVIFLENAIH